MNRGDGGWRIVSGNVTDGKDGWFRLEHVSGNEYRLSAQWENRKYLNFDRFDSGSFVYANKDRGAVFTIENFSSSGVDNIEAGSAVNTVYPAVTSGEITIEPAAPSKASVVNISGSYVDGFDVPCKGTYRLDVPNSVYLLILTSDDNTVTTTHKIIVRH